MYCAGPSLREPSFSHDYCSSHPHGTESAMDRQVSVVFRTPSSSHIPTQHPHTSIIHSQPLQPHFTSWASQSPTWPQERDVFTQSHTHTQDTSHMAQANCEIVLTHFISDSSWKQLSSFHPIIHTSTTIRNHLPSHAPAHPSQALFAVRHSPPSVHKTNSLHKLTSPHRKYNTAAECSVP